MCGKSFSESGYLKRNLKGTNLERKHFSAPNVTGVFQHQSSKFNRGLTGERNHLGAPNGTRAALSQITERIYTGPLQAHSVIHKKVRRDCATPFRNNAFIIKQCCLAWVFLQVQISLSRSLPVLQIPE